MILVLALLLVGVQFDRTVVGDGDRAPANAWARHGVTQVHFDSPGREQSSRSTVVDPLGREFVTQWCGHPHRASGDRAKQFESGLGEAGCAALNDVVLNQGGGRL
ncbi:MAG: hypothetical protein ACI9QQ_002952 [Myxococcota bacterium]|jgi:hypothetical protein